MESSQKKTIAKAAGFMMFTIVLSRFLGYLRELFISYKFGQNIITDAYNAAFSIPDFLYTVLVGGALSSAFIPVFSSYLAQEREKEGWKVASTVFNLLMLVLFCAVTLGIIFTPSLVKLLVKDFSDEAVRMTVSLTRIMFAQVLFMCLAGISTGILHSYKHFTAPAVGGLLYNLAIILGGLLLAVPVEKLWPGYGIAGFSFGVVFGAMLQFAVQVPPLRRIGVRYSLTLDLRDPGVKKLGLLLVPIFISLSVSQFNLFITQNLASGLPDGMLTALRYGQRIMYMPVGVFAVAIAVAIFPALTYQATQRKTEDFRQTASMGLRSVIFIVLPISVIMAVLSEPLIRFMYEWGGGKFTHKDTLVTARALLFYCPGLFAYGAIHVLNRVFYALHDTKTTVLAGFCAICMNILFSLLLVKPMQHEGLALAYSLAGIANVFLLILFWKRKLKNISLRLLTQSFGKVLLASALMGAAVWGVSRLWGNIFTEAGKINQGLELLVCAVIGVAVYAAAALFWRMEEAEQARRIFLKRFRRKQTGEGNHN
ncbi:MAG: murein biosynthesis integral membrane protein MurJ [Clostridiales bacterium]|nr:murein biosynthesis integral membrane protein MurJ [Clostridiales bacterium]